MNTVLERMAKEQEEKDKKTTESITQLLAYIICLFTWPAFFIWANHITFCIPILDKLGIAGLTYWQYWLGIFVTRACVAALFRSIKKN